MRKFPGVYNDRGYTTVRIWLTKKYNKDGTTNPPYRKSFGPWNEANAKRAKDHVEEVRKRFDAGTTLVDPEAISVEFACDYYYKRDWVDNPQRSGDSIRNTKYAIDRFKEYWKGRAWHSIRPTDVEAYVAWRKTDGQIQDGSVNRELTLLSAMFSKIRQWDNLQDIGPYLQPTDRQGSPYNPVEFVTRISTIASQRERTATEAELLKVKVYCDQNDPDMLQMIRRSILTGLRKSDLEKVNGLADVRGVLAKSQEKKLFRFPLDFSHELNYKNFDRRWTSLREACQMEDFHWHDWRHTSATMLEMLDFSDEQIRQFLGHSSVEMTRLYMNSRGRLKHHVDSLDSHLTTIWQAAPTPVPANPNVKTCTRCHIEKDLSEYNKNSAFKSGLDSQCKVCVRAKTQAYREQNPNLRAEEYARRKAEMDLDPEAKAREYERIRQAKLQAKDLGPVSSAVERSLDMGKVGGSSPSSGTIQGTETVSQNGVLGTVSPTENLKN